MTVVFDWDQWNIQKNEIKHGVSRLEAESLFYDRAMLIFPDVRHSTQNESRYISYATSYSGRVLMCAFTVCRKKVRIISVRMSSKKERLLHEEEKK